MHCFLRALTFCCLLLASATALSTASAQNPFTKPANASSDSKTWVELGPQRWHLDGPKFVVAFGNDGQAAGLFNGQSLILLEPNGTPRKQILSLPKMYGFIGVRPDYLVAVCDAPARLEILNRSTGALIRGADLGDGHPLSFAMHPTTPVAYVCLTQATGVIAAGFVAVDEAKLQVRRDPDFAGQSVTIDPTGRFLATGYSETFTTGASLLHVPDAGRPAVPRPIPGQPGIGRAPGNSRQPPGDRWELIRRYANVSIAFLYDLSEPMTPEGLAFLPKFTNFARGLRMSHDGRHLLGSPLATNGGFSVFDTSKLSDPARELHVNRTVASATASTDVVCHPLLPLAAVACDDRIAFFNIEDGTQPADKPPITLPEFNRKDVMRICFSPDSRSLLVVARTPTNSTVLTKVSVPLTAAETARLSRGPTRIDRINHGVRFALAKIDALRGGLPKSMRASEIFKEFADSVVVVRDSESSGTGYIIGDSGLILTCAHCVSPLRPVTVVYHPKGKSDVRETVDATVLQRDRKVDLAILQIEAKSPLHSVTLAPPVDVANGEDVTIIANPGLGAEILDNTVTTGVVSSGKRTLEGNDYIQSSAAVNPGSSGGPMFNHNGQVIGSVDLKGKIEGVGFAVPSPVITRFILKSSRRTEADGQFSRVWLDAAETRGLAGKFVSSADKSLTIIKSETSERLSLPLEKLSVGDQKLLDLMTSP